MRKKLEFDKEKYLQMSIWKLLIVIFIGLLILLIGLLNKAQFTMSDVGIVITICLFIDTCYGLRLYLDYKYYRDNFECKYKDGSLTYKLVRYPNAIESLIYFFNNLITVELNVDRLDRIEQKYGRIYVYGKMTLQKTTKKTKVKILNKYSFPDYCKGEEKLTEFVKTKK